MSSENISQREIIESLWGDKKGLVVGEEHSSRAAIKFLIDNAEHFQAEGIKYLFTERFLGHKDYKKFGYDVTFNGLFEQYMKDEFDEDSMEFEILKTESNCIRSSHFIKKVDGKVTRILHINDEKESEYTLIKLLKKMKDCSIRVVGIDIEEATKGDVYISPEARKESAKVKSKSMHTKIKETLEGDDDFQEQRGDKFIVFTGNAHAGDFIAYDSTKIDGLGTKLGCKSIFIIEDSYMQTEFLVGSSGKKQVEKNKYCLKSCQLRLQEGKNDPSGSKEYTVIDAFLSVEVAKSGDYENLPAYSVTLQKDNSPSNEAKHTTDEQKSDGEEETVGNTEQQPQLSSSCAATVASNPSGSPQLFQRAPTNTTDHNAEPEPQAEEISTPTNSCG